MKIKNTTEKFNFYEENGNYTIDFGTFKKGQSSIDLLITGIEDSSLLDVVPTCQCSVSEKKIIDKNTQKVNISYNECSTKVSKVMEIRYKNQKIGIIKITGQCTA